MVPQRLWFAFSACAWLCGSSEQALAQGRGPIELSASYQLVIDASLDESGMVRDAGAHGWSVDAAFPLTRHLRVVGAIDAGYGRETMSLDSNVTFVNTWTDMTLLGGVRVGPAATRVTPFVHALGGFLMSRYEEEYRGSEFPGPYEGDQKLVVLDLGGGVSILVRPRVGVRLGFDVRVDMSGVAVEAGAGDTTMVRALAGIVFKIP